MAFSFGLKAIFLIQAASLGFCTIEVRPLEKKTLEGFECISNNDITIQFKNITSIYTQTLAECSTILKGCYLTEQSLDNIYAVFYTGRGARFYTNTVTDKSHGTYSCCETYDTQLCHSIKFCALTDNASTKSEWDMTNQKHNSSERTKEDCAVLSVISTTLCISCIINVALVCLHFRKKGCIRWARLMCGKGRFKRDRRPKHVFHPSRADFEWLMSKSDNRVTQCDGGGL
ncbi:uncharacterized protein LOC127849503 [Dreissena polymorpha]|uniref:Uncharacterized protein n=1 Tax=Dreissena polymorpha TaxID=45954 RepID=A0A9D4CYV1_DREPO|nr:uncharacterized protein LOC127849503 [Dreissena polymorpha]XP_052238068.1 uncharacterized protein LOC127849503 [Dreissena polymorpha]KAH3734674.1 hypothetical protein DPMN_041114 [Dreissena polymorpha]